MAHPFEHVIGERLNENRKNNSYSLVPINCTEQFIPLRHVLKNFFQLKDVLTDTLEYINKCEIQNSILINFVQGSVWKKKKRRT